MSFPARTVIVSYQGLEAKLASVLDVIPYCQEHMAVWSPVLIPVLLDAGSQLDSLWRAQSRLSRYTKKDPKIVDFFTYFSRQVAPRWVTFWGQEVPAKLKPFQAWDGAAGTSKDDYLKLPWWDAYNGVKHDRLMDRKKATIEHAVAAVAGLFIALLKCDACRDEIAQTSWLSSKYPNPAAHLSEDSPSTGGAFVTAESHLFTYAVGWSTRSIVAGDIWNSVSGSERFRRWFDKQAE